MKQYAFGVDIGGTTIKMGLFTTTGDLLEKWEIVTRTEDGGKYILEDIAKAVEGKLAEKEISKLDVEGIGMGVPGPVGDDGTVYQCVNLGWGVFNVEIELKGMTGMKVKAGNDANVAALGELWQGGGKGYKNMVMITLGTGVGGGVIMNEKIISGSTGAGGEIGHMHMVDGETEVCGCGNRGCLEQYASANGIARVTAKYLAEHDDESLLRKEEKITSLAIFNAAKEGDVVAVRMIDEMANVLGKALAQVACVVNPQVFVIGGGMSKAGDMLIDVVQKYFKKYAFHATRDTFIKVAELSNDAGMIGGVRLILE
ncbi:MAG: ROK family glucokinase [Hespellia sp.]|nr:ROK family glucokinase [Hespellia sp.]